MQTDFEVLFVHIWELLDGLLREVLAEVFSGQFDEGLGVFEAEEVPYEGQFLDDLHKLALVDCGVVRGEVDEVLVVVQDFLDGLKLVRTSVGQVLSFVEDDSFEDLPIPVYHQFVSVQVALTVVVDGELHLDYLRLVHFFVHFVFEQRLEHAQELEIAKEHVLALTLLAVIR